MDGKDFGAKADESEMCKRGPTMAEPIENTYLCELALGGLAPNQNQNDGNALDSSHSEA